jgi:tetratricopeptide (TPR) repeat protein
MNAQFDQANQAYRSENYQRCVQIYQSILSQGYENSELYYNLGNAYYKMNNIPAAILQYERARKLSPSDPDIAHNLALANLRVTDKIDAIPELFFINWWHDLVDLRSADQWAWIAIASLWGTVLATALLLTNLLPGSVRTIFSALAFAGILFSAVSLTGMAAHSHADKNHHFAIIFSPSVTVKSAPDENSTNLFVLHEGVKIELLDKVSQWSKFKLADGKIGWARSTTFETI